ncbi:DUF2256 domain-containing protein [Nostoc ellipsosporum NOK]|nr:DUF2256 domain-containing protein [Nostoc ellipsosporum NOK]
MKRTARFISKTALPQKTCPVCLRPFNWRKKWERTWPEVKYCSERCRRSPQRNSNRCSG